MSEGENAMIHSHLARYPAPVTGATVLVLSLIALLFALAPLFGTLAAWRSRLEKVSAH
jgi:hypothetical protein